MLRHKQAEELKVGIDINILGCITTTYAWKCVNQRFQSSFSVQKCIKQFGKFK